MISVCVIVVGSTTMVEVRDSPAMRTVSLRMFSRMRPSTISWPARPPTRPVATTGWVSAFNARATLMPLPPGSVRLSLARCLNPTWKLGTVSVLSIAALGVTVMITCGPRDKAGAVGAGPRTVRSIANDNACRARRERHAVP